MKNDCTIQDIALYLHQQNKTQVVMATLVKGTPEYQKAQKMANELQGWAEKTRVNDTNYFNLGVDVLSSFLNKIIALDVFASQVAKSVEATINVFGYKVANMSAKQAWILACSAVENGIEL